QSPPIHPHEHNTLFPPHRRPGRRPDEARHLPLPQHSSLPGLDGAGARRAPHYRPAVGRPRGLHARPVSQLRRLFAVEGIMPVRVMKVFGVKQLIVTNAAGGLNPDFNVGDIMIINDHVNMQGFAGDSPLRGSNDERFGPRFPAMNNCYDKKMIKIALETGTEMGLNPGLKEGVYIMLGGPCYETPAELRLLRVLGVDAVGMSTVPEVVVARHCGIDVFAFSLITNKCITDQASDEKASHEEVIDTGNKRKADLQKLITCLVEKLWNMEKQDQ
ncbi:UNVERIFIED_CONTAM: hypothetical protein GTU68_005660, partial [Idotea baltica]|nr:hypothetical protein [Idotea baltica]